MSGVDTRAYSQWVRIDIESLFEKGQISIANAKVTEYVIIRLCLQRVKCFILTRSLN